MNHHQFDQSHYSNFHMPQSPQEWIACSHHNQNHNTIVELSGQYKFNFFCNHVVKFFHRDDSMYENQSYEHWLKVTVAVSFGLCKYCNYTAAPYFDFNDLVNHPDIFYDRIVRLQATYNESKISENYFDHAKNLFIQSCVNTLPHFMNWNSPWWNMFVLGQLMDKNIWPNFDISSPENWPKIKSFVKEQISQCANFAHWKNPSGVDININLPSWVYH